MCCNRAGENKLARMKYDRPVTPAEHSPAIAAMCSHLCPGQAPAYIDVVPIPDAPPDECFPLVAAYAEEWGGTQVIGWTIWELPGLFVEAEFHSVWRNPDGELVDITPKRTPSARIYFVEDVVRTYAGLQVNNIRRPLSDDPLLLRYLQSFDERFEIMNAGERANQHGAIVLSGEEVARMESLDAEGYEAFLQLRSQLPDIGPYSPCPCGSGRKVKWCHRAVQNAG